jgi:general secretion pathway protein J
MDRPNRQSDRRGRRERGFTLLEVLISVGLLAGLTTIMWVTINNMFETRDRITEQYERYQIMRVALDRMTRELASAYDASAAHGAEPNAEEKAQRAKKQKKGGQKQALAQREPVEFGMRGRSDEVQFTSFAHTRTTKDERASHHAEIGYSIQRTRQNGDLVESLVRREDTTIDDDITEGGKVYVLIPRIESIEFEYWDPGEVELGTQEESARGSWVDEWDTSDSRYEGRLPFRVRITVTLPPIGPRGESREFVTQTEIQTNQELDL